MQPTVQRIDLASESKNTATALTNVLYKIEQGDLPLDDADKLLEVPEIHNLQTIIRRWSNMEEKLKSIISPSADNQVRIDIQLVVFTSL